MGARHLRELDFQVIGCRAPALIRNFALQVKVIIKLVCCVMACNLLHHMLVDFHGHFAVCGHIQFCLCFHVAWVLTCASIRLLCVCPCGNRALAFHVIHESHAIWASHDSL